MENQNSIDFVWYYEDIRRWSDWAVQRYALIVGNFSNPKNSFCSTKVLDYCNVAGRKCTLVVFEAEQTVSSLAQRFSVDESRCKVFTGAPYRKVGSNGNFLGDLGFCVESHPDYKNLEKEIERELESRR